MTVLDASENVEPFQPDILTDNMPDLLLNFTHSTRAHRDGYLPAKLTFYANSDRATTDRVHAFSAVINEVSMAIEAKSNTYYRRHTLDAEDLPESKGFFSCLNKPPYAQFGQHATRYAEMHYLGKEIATALIDILIAEECFQDKEERA